MRRMAPLPLLPLPVVRTFHPCTLPHLLPHGRHGNQKHQRLQSTKAEFRAVACPAVVGHSAISRAANSRQPKPRGPGGSHGRKTFDSHHACCSSYMVPGAVSHSSPASSLALWDPVTPCGCRMSRGTGLTALHTQRGKYSLRLAVDGTTVSYLVLASICGSSLRNVVGPFSFYLIMTIGIVGITVGVRTFGTERPGEF